MIPEAEFIRSELTIRDLSLPDSVFLTRRSLLRWLSLELGFITPDETRDTFFSVLDALLFYIFHLHTNPTTKDIQDYLSKSFKSQFISSHNTGTVGSHSKSAISEKLIRYHLSKLIQTGLIQRKQNRYFLAVPYNAKSTDYSALFQQLIVEKAEKIARNSAKAFSRLAQLYQ